MKPILFNTEMVRAILEGRKTVTRRVVKPQPGKNAALLRWDYGIPMFEDGTSAPLPYHPGNILYVRETWAQIPDLFGEFPQYVYRADYTEDQLNKPEPDSNGEVDFDFPWCVKWHPSIHMPKEAARIFLRVTDVRVERLREITEEQAEAEGCSAGCFEIAGGPWGVEDDPDEWTAKEQFSTIWDSTIKPADLPRYGWAANPWVWVIEFERCEKPERGRE